MTHPRAFAPGLPAPGYRTLRTSEYTDGYDYRYNDSVRGRLADRLWHRSRAFCRGHAAGREDHEPHGASLTA